MEQVIIVGAGPAGIIAAATLMSRFSIDPLILEKNAQAGGAVHEWALPASDFPGEPSRNEFLAMLGRTIATHTLRIRYETPAVRLTQSKNAFIVETPRERFEAQAVLIATGERQRTPGIPGYNELLGKGVMEREDFEQAGKQVVVVGGGRRALENAWRMAESGAEVTIVHRRAEFREDAGEWVARAQEHPRISILLGSEPIALQGTAELNTVEVRTQKGMVHIPANRLFLAIGTEANLAFIDPALSLRKDALGYAQVERDGSASVTGLYIVGDAAAPAINDTRVQAKFVAHAIGSAAVAAKACALMCGTPDNA